MKKTNKAWKSFDFGPDKLEKKTQTPIKNTGIIIKQQTETKNSSYPKQSFDFFTKLAPVDITDLAVHPKKIEEIKFWLEKTFSGQCNKVTSFLLLSGPTGCGKTATLSVLCKMMDISICEWVNPIDQDFELLRGPNQVNRFLEFITTESNYSSLFEVSSERKLVLVEDFPNVFLKNHEEFNNILEECYFRSKYPIAFICTEVANNKINLVYKLFPQEVMNKYQITHINFNACAPTLLKNALRRAHNLVQKNKDIFQTPSQTVVDAILASCMGDIRCAVNQYYFACLLGSQQLPTESSSRVVKPGVKRKRSQNTMGIKIMAKDETLGLFHALGRILNPKWKQHENSNRLDCDIESLIMELESQPQNLLSFLFVNYIKYFGDLREVQLASEILCLSQRFFEKWSESKDLHQYPLWLSILGLMTMNTHKVSKWNQIEGPKTIKKVYNNRGLISVLDNYYITIITNVHGRI